MFTGFASENTPAIQVWDVSQSYNGTTVISLPDDCPPIAYFKTGSNTSGVNIYLPSAPIEGKQITIINQRYGATANQPLVICASDVSGTGSDSTLFQLRPGSSVSLVYSKNIISYGAATGTLQSGWTSLNLAPPSAGNSYAVALAGYGSTASGRYSATIGGDFANASGLYASVLAGSTNTASGSQSSVVGGLSNSATSSNAVVVGGQSNSANGNNSFVAGGRVGTARAIQGNAVFPASIIPISSTLGCTQAALLVLGVQTTDATATVLRSNTSAASTTNQVILPDNSAYFFRGEVVAGVTSAGNTKGWTVEGVIKRGAGVGTTTLVGTPTVTSLYADAGATTWSIAVTADTTNGGLAVTVTGQAATTIRWVCKIETTEMTF